MTTWSDAFFRRFASAFATSAGISDGTFATGTPARSKRAIFSAAVPAPPETMAPAWPIRFPAGAVRPAMKATTGFEMCSSIRAAASSSSVPPISPIRTMASVFSSASNCASASTNRVPTIGSPPMPMQVDWPILARVSCQTTSYVSVPLRLTSPMRPGACMKPGMMPTLHSPGVMRPGQFGPMSRVDLPRR